MYWKPGDPRPSDFVLTETAEQIDVIYNPRRHLPLTQQKKGLPVFSYRREFLWAVESSRVILVVGEAGSGKSTQFPQYLYEAGWTQDEQSVVVVLPRRLAVVTLAARVAEELGKNLGEEIGFATSDESRGSPNSCLRFVTDGVLLREVFSDPLLLKYNVIIMDDCHERHLQSDLLLGILKKIQKKRQYLRLVISSATLDAEVFVDHFRSNCMTDEILSERSGHRTSRWDTQAIQTKPLKDISIIIITGRPYPLEIRYLTKPCRNYLRAACTAVSDIHRRERDLGSVLVFLPGRDEIETLAEMLEGLYFDRQLGKLEVAVLYAALPPDLQIQALRRPKSGYRKVIISTNLAESSVTIEGVHFVVDCGFVKSSYYDPNVGVNILATIPVSKASAEQRAGRAGRTCPGICYRLYSQNMFQSILPEFSTPEILRSDLTSVVLYLLSLGIDNITTRIELPTPASSEEILAALTELHALKAIDEFGRLTSPLGQRMAELPLSPKLARFLLISTEPEFNCSYEAMVIAAMVTAGAPWVYVSPKSRVRRELLEATMRSIGVTEGDLLTLYNIYKQVEFYKDEDPDWIKRHMISSPTISRAERIKSQLERYFKGWNLEILSVGNDTTRLCKAICSGFFLNACRRQRDGTYRFCRSVIPSASLPPICIHPSSIASPSPPLFLVFHEAVAIGSSSVARIGIDGKQLSSSITQLTGVTPIEPKWLEEVAGHYFKLNLTPGT